MTWQKQGTHIPHPHVLKSHNHTHPQAQSSRHTHPSQSFSIAAEASAATSSIEAPPMPPAALIKASVAFCHQTTTAKTMKTKYGTQTERPQRSVHWLPSCFVAGKNIWLSAPTSFGLRPNPAAAISSVYSIPRPSTNARTCGE